MGKQRRQSDNNSRESLMEENVITNKPSSLQMINQIALPTLSSLRS
jgi:hypothetical protein